MERLPPELFMKILSLLDYQNLANAQQVSRKWEELGSDNMLWSLLIKERWGSDYYDSLDSSKCLKYAYEVQDRCDRIGVESKIIREGEDYYLVHRGETQRHLGSRRPSNNSDSYSLKIEIGKGESVEDEPTMSILDRILFFVGDMETASSAAKRSRHV